MKNVNDWMFRVNIFLLGALSALALLRAML
jgi:hypothetical protein